MLVMLLVSLVPLLVFGLLSYYQARDVLISQVGERLQAGSNLAMSQIDRTFAFSKENIHSWAELEIMQEIAKGDPESMVSAMLEDYQRSYGIYSNLVVSDVDGSIVAAGDQDLLGVDVSRSPWFIETMRQSAPRMGELRLDPYIGGYGVAISIPIFKEYSDEEIIGVLNASFSWTELLTTVNSMEVVSEGQSTKGYAILIDRDGYIIAAPGFILLEDDGSTADSDMLRVFGKRWWAAEDPYVLQQLLNAPDQRYIRRDDQRLLVVNTPAHSYEHLAATGWSLLLVRDAEDALSVVASIRERALLIALITAIVIAGLAYLLAWQITRPITLLSAWSKDLAKGNLSRELSIKASDEIGQLAGALDEMRVDIKGYMDDLSEAKERFQSLIDSVDCVVWEAEVNPVRIIGVSGKVGHVLGYSAADMRVAMSEWESWIHPDNADDVQNTFRVAVDDAQDAFVEFKAKHSDGHWVWLKAFISVAIEGLQVVGLRGVMVDISDIVKASEEMKEARDLAVKTAESKSRFLAIVSHEIRTPMNGMLGMLDMLKDASLAADEQAKIDMACQSGKNLVALVDDVMDFTQLEAGEMEFNYTQVDIQQLFHDVVALAAPDAYNKGLDVGVIQEANLPRYVLADAVKLRQVLSALLSNAVKFTSHGSVLLWAEMLAQGRLYVEIKDTGVGISKEGQEEIFQPFIQEDASTTRRFEGSGLGLALCQRLVEAMGGSVGVKSIKGVGSSFYIELGAEEVAERGASVSELRHLFYQQCPSSSALLIGDLPATKMVLQIACQQWGVGFHWEPKESRVVRNLDEILSADSYRWIFIAQEMSDRFWERMNPYLKGNDEVRVIQLRLPNEKYGQRPLPHLYVPFAQEALSNLMLNTKVETSAVLGQGVDLVSKQHLTVDKSRVELAGVENFPRVLVVDDNPVNRKVAGGFLKKMGFQVDMAEDGKQAVDAVEKCAYGMVFMDCQMPIMDGYEATKAIRERFPDELLPIIAVTANAMEGDREKCFAAGMDDYIAKPLRMDKLTTKVSLWLDKLQSNSRSEA